MTAPAMEYGSAEWQQDRANYIGASDTPHVIEVSPYGGRTDLYLQKRGELVVEPTHAMQRGHIYEDATVQEFGLLFPELRFVTAPTLRHRESDLFRATPDRIIVLPSGEKAIAEVKQVTPHLMGRYGESGSDDAPLYNVAQVQSLLEVTQLNKAYLIVNFGFEIRWYLFTRDAELGRYLFEESVGFMRDHVIPGIPPEPSPEHDSYEAITRRFLGASKVELDADEETAGLILEFASVKATKKAAEDREDELKAVLATRIGTAYGIDAGKAGRVLWPQSEGKISKDFDGLVRELKVPADVVQKFTRVGNPYRTMRYYPPKKGAK
jgi:putative phage-type endonuclease